MRPQVLSIAFILLLLTPVLVTVSSFKLRHHKIRKQVRTEIKAGVSEEDLVLLQFARSDIHSILEWKHSKEFKYKNEMYDIISSKETVDTISYWCWHDSKETDLNKRMTAMISKLLSGDRDQNSEEDQLISFFKNMYFKPLLEIDLIQKAEKAEHPDFRFYIKEFGCKPPTPPPNLC